MTVGARKRPDSLNERIGTAAKLTAKSNSEFPERDGHCAVLADAWNLTSRTASPAAREPEPKPALPPSDAKHRHPD